MFDKFFTRDKTQIVSVSTSAPEISVQQLQKEMETARGDWARFLLRLHEHKIRQGKLRIWPIESVELPIPIDFNE